MAEWKLVPVDPTPEMKEAYFRRYGCPSYGVGHEYRFMVSAAPAQPAALEEVWALWKEIDECAGHSLSPEQCERFESMLRAIGVKGPDHA